MGCGCGGGEGDCGCGPPQEPGEGREIPFFHGKGSYSGAAGGRAYYSDPVPFKDYKRLTLSAELLAVTQNATVDLTLQESMDLTIWRDVAAYPLSVGTPENQTNSDLALYIRLKVLITGADGTATLWIRGVGRGQ
jgi:hypothetical protein